MGEENNRKPKRLIRVRKFRANPEENIREEEESASANRDPDSSFSGGEEEIQVIEPGSHSDCSTTHPIEFMFPHLRQEGLNTTNLTKTMSTTDITKLLIGKKAHFTSRNRYRRREAVDFTTIEEGDETSSSEDLRKTSSRKLSTSRTELTDDGNESDISENEENDGK